ncbi:MAG TPA: glycoside hydrolase family 2 protein [Verrucomicrobiae bacterium]
MSGTQLSKRKFLATAAAATAAACTWKPLLSFASAAPPRRSRIDLNGWWRAAKDGTEEWIPATVPGCIHTDLLATEKIPDPYYRDNEQAVQWVGETNWIFRRAFQVPASFLKHDRGLLRCEGLDTLAVVRLNGQEVGRADNMFRLWEFDARSALKPGDNTIDVVFSSPLPYMKERQAKRVLYEWAGQLEPKGRAWVRKEPCNFGWDWGPVLITCGIWRDISLVAFDMARLADVLILQDHSAKGRVSLEIQLAAETTQAAPLAGTARVLHKGKRVAAGTCSLQAGKGRIPLVVSDPKLWWPAGMGQQPLYSVEVELLDAQGKVLDRTARRIGLRTIKLLEPDNEKSLRLEANGVPFFAKGANWIPADAFANRVTPQILRRYVEDAVAVNMNTLRFWGGGYYEEEALFDACDELGICVWLDFKFACSSYPAFDAAFMENVRQEARDNVRRLRHHPCIGVWCGNNEIGLMVKPEWSDSSMGRADYDKLFKGLLGDQVKELAPQANYVSGSPDCGDTHYWQVWHGGKTFDAYRTFTGFASEFGFQSFPEPKTVRAYTDVADRASVVTPVMDWHQRSPKGDEKIRDMCARYFKPPKDFDSALWLSQILQGYGIKVGAEYWRQTMPKSMACVYWQYNDCWPVASWSSVDYFGRWKALHYLARRFYAPILVSGLEDAGKGTIDVFISSDLSEPCKGELSWNATDPAGRSLRRESLAVEIAPRQSSKIKTLDLSDMVANSGAANVLTWLRLTVAGRTVSENLVLLATPKEIRLTDPVLKHTVSKKRNGMEVSLTASRPALWTWLELEGMDARYSDNFVHVTADAPARILVEPKRSLSRAEFARALRVRSLFDTYTDL